MTNGEKILDEMGAFDVNAAASVPDRGADENELPFESLSDYSIAPLTFGETAEMVRKRTEFFFSLSVKYNRKSAKYLEVLGYLEKGVKYLGSCCLTLEVLKQQKKDHPEIENLSTHWLYGLVSFNVRKLDRAVDEFISGNPELPGKWLDMQFRFLSLAERLKSTERKIYECSFSHSSGLSSRTAIEANLFTKNASNRDYVRRRITPPVFRAGSSLPVLKNEVPAADSCTGNNRAAEITDGVPEDEAANLPKRSRQHALPAADRSGRTDGPAEAAEIIEKENSEGRSILAETETGHSRIHRNGSDETGRENPERMSPDEEMIVTETKGTIWETDERQRKIDRLASMPIWKVLELGGGTIEGFNALWRDAFADDTYEADLLNKIENDIGTFDDASAFGSGGFISPEDDDS